MPTAQLCARTLIREQDFNERGLIVVALCFFHDYYKKQRPGNTDVGTARVRVSNMQPKTMIHCCYNNTNNNVNTDEHAGMYAQYECIYVYIHGKIVSSQYK